MTPAKGSAVAKTAATKENPEQTEKIMAGVKSRDLQETPANIHLVGEVPHKKELQHFAVLNAIDMSEKTEKKKTGNTELTYLSWAWAWAAVKQKFPDAEYHIKKFENNLPYVYDPLTGYMVFTEMTIEGITHEMWLPVMNGANKAMKDKPYQYQVMQWQNGKKVSVTKDCAAADMFDINKTLMRCLVKNISMFGLGLYIYAGEDLPTPPEDEIGSSNVDASVKKRQQEKKEELQSDESPELTKARENIAKELMRISKKMSPSEKITFADETIKPIIGTAYYMNCENIEMLSNLYKKLKEIK